MKVAILHEMLVKFWWAEKVVETFLDIFPDADLFTLIYDEEKVWKFFPKNRIKKVPSITQKIYNITKNQRFCLPFMSMWVEELDFSEYDLVLASSSGFAHWAITKPETKFIVYYHSPARYLWDWTNENKRDIGYSKWVKSLIINYLFLKIRQWDLQASFRSDLSLANSKNVQNRIKKYYKKESFVLFPPVETHRFEIKENWDYYIIISALTEFKKIDIAIKSFNKMSDKKLKIVWWWPLEKSLKSMINSDNIELVWPKYWDDLKDLLENSKWLIFPWEEDFWIVPVEAMACWKPVFAYRWWWLLETVIDWKTWRFFEDKTWLDFVEKFEEFDREVCSDFFDKAFIRQHSMSFSKEKFKEKLLSFVNSK